MKILVTGDRNWSDINSVHSVLSSFPKNTILIHGCCRGLDLICAAIGESLGFEIRAYPADWNTHGKSAGPMRNQRMIDSEHSEKEKIDFCLAFHDDIASSKGTADMIARAKAANITTKLYDGTWDR